MSRIENRGVASAPVTEAELENSAALGHVLLKRAWPDQRDPVKQCEIRTSRGDGNTMADIYRIPCPGHAGWMVLALVRGEPGCGVACEAGSSTPSCTRERKIAGLRRRGYEVADEAAHPMADAVARGVICQQLTNRWAAAESAAVDNGGTRGARADKRKQLMDEIVGWVNTNPGRSQNKIAEALKAEKSAVRQAVDDAIRMDLLRIEDGRNRSRLHFPAAAP